ncbi:hypothetical protein BOX15_Mlig001290g5 [Macrostomum lignano]|uniref:Uncharacterized protein n=1 Tax=Macrostomum lignano TaxID=282301 RepID=A0A267GKZ5_9PLAT|nr:hypothetical protein BOX15_Mlig001290g5 [Macrostomum lignano]
MMWRTMVKLAAFSVLPFPFKNNVSKIQKLLKDAFFVALWHQFLNSRILLAVYHLSPKHNCFVHKLCMQCSSVAGSRTQFSAV